MIPQQLSISLPFPPIRKGGLQWFEPSARRRNYPKYRSWGNRRHVAGATIFPGRKRTRNDPAEAKCGPPEKMGKCQVARGSPQGWVTFISICKVKTPAFRRVDFISSPYW